ncbi:hypothetical protein JR316_0005018 [Psilocybe cubensis]|uniref:Uncharacterized protein n=2 Tax=Psilocybe cubensis TaxID=181762 RepID=A0ACB8H4T2_PSICU|nr:hypothetical protein JR316_0005018 [Psilocybe cubensis]KAH9482918.1 hypothetical protein JR316_0005018 [Psilocybe cubensis]
MASIADISQALGDYMLRGWVLTDQSCPTPGCAVPLLRSPAGRTPITTICAKCDPTNPPSLPQGVVPASSSNATTESQHSRSSTPPTELSEVPDSPLFVPIEESEETRRRRAQSDQASSEIGKRLLKGWAMLGDECPNDTCYGVPLVRPPKSGGEKDPRKECVICGNVYVSGVDWAGTQTLALQETKTATASTDDSVRSQADSSQIRSTPPTTLHQEIHKFSAPLNHQSNDKASLQTQSSVPAVPHSLPVFEHHQKGITPQSDSLYDVTSQSLRTSLRTLTDRLISLTSHPALVEPSAIGSTADAISKVAQALVQMKNLGHV